MLSPEDKRAAIVLIIKAATGHILTEEEREELLLHTKRPFLRLYRFDPNAILPSDHHVTRACRNAVDEAVEFARRIYATTPMINEGVDYQRYFAKLYGDPILRYATAIVRIAVLTERLRMFEDVS